MKNETSLVITFIMLIMSSCTPATTAVPTKPSIPISTFTPIPPTATLLPTLTPTVYTQSILDEKLNCTVQGVFLKCIDDILAIEFEYPTVWGQITTILKPGGYSGYAYDYYFEGASRVDIAHLVAGGRSKDFSEGRGGIPTDFSGYGDTLESCDSNWQDIYPICQEIYPNVTWMIRLPNANYFCDYPGYYSTAIFRIEINLPNNSTINGFVFESSFGSNEFSNQLENDLYPILGIGSDMFPTKCNVEDQEAFDRKLDLIVAKINERTMDKETQNNIDELIHLTTSIIFR